MAGLARRFGMERIALAVVAAVAGCHSTAAPNTPVAAGIDPAGLYDPNGYGDSPALPMARDLFRVGERIRMAQRPAELPAHKSCLVLSGGGAFGAFQAGILVGWSEAAQRPAFDAVTGVSTGALVAVFAFLGPEYDSELRRVYTTLKTEDIYIRKGRLRSLFSESLAENHPLAKQIDRVLTPETVDRIAAEHLKGRRLYVGTTDLESRRPVVWDIGAIASKHEPGGRELIAKLLLASAAIPAFFPPVDIAVDVDGQSLVERHIDGGVTQNLFFRPPQVPQDFRHRPPADFMFGSDLYVVVAGKLYADPEVVEPRVLKIAASSVSTLIYAETRVELIRLYTIAMVSGMNYHLAAIPQDFHAPSSSTTFDPVEMSRMFEEGRRQALNGSAWRCAPPGVEEREDIAQRAGTRLARKSSTAPPQRGNESATEK
jgi:predicted acylesterase/phospholipase RssA